MPFSDQQGKLYLGRYTQPQTAVGDILQYDAKELTTHAVCVGMTGSGKSGLGMALLEEAALNGIPALVIDPKGDMSNLLLTFPDLLPDDFGPWIDVDDARRRNLSADQYAGQIARTWREKLAEWDIDGTRIARLKQKARFVIYTPGSDAGRPVSILRSLQAPDLDWDQYAETLRETISGTVSALLAMLDIDSDPVTGREHSLLATIIEHAWRAGQDMDLANLIIQVQKPPFDQLGVLPLEVFYPEKERAKLMLSLNGLLASPQFSEWLEGDPLQIETLLRAPDGRPQISIFTMAYLSDAERSFFVTLLLEQVRAWLRVQEGTTRLRALLYFDELYGFMPPHPANPPTKEPLLTLLKQARSQGLGLVLATQNPIDIDYKGLSNAGTWFVGKLQTANDRERVLEGLDSASLEAGVSLNRQALDKMIAGLAPRTFLIHRMHDQGPHLFKTRHTMSYLRGPLTREQIRRLMQQEPRRVPAQRQPQPPAPQALPVEPTQPVMAVGVSQVIPPPTVDEPPLPSGWDQYTKMPPVLPTGIKQYFLPVQVPLEWAIHSAETGGQAIIYEQKQLVYRPALLARAAVSIDDNRRNVHQQLTVTRVMTVPDDDALLAWDAEPMDVQVTELDAKAAQEARFVPLPAQLSSARQINAQQKRFADYVYRETAISLFSYPRFRLTSNVEELESQFKRRCYKMIEEKRDQEMDKLQDRYTPKFERLEARIRREERELEQDEIEYDARKREELLSAGESVFNLLSRRRSSRMLSTASRKRRLTQQAKADVEESVDTIDDLEQQIADLEQELEEKAVEIQEQWAEVAERLDSDLQTVQIRPRKSDIFIQAFGVAWVPFWQIQFEEQGAEQQLSLCAFESEG